MTASRAFLLLLCVAIPAVLTGCILHPDHVTFYAEHNEAETAGSPRRTTTTGNRVGVSATYDLTKAR